MSRRCPLKSSITRGLAVLGRLCLIVSLWQGPVPMFHSHGTDVGEVTSSAAEIEHLSEYHPEVPVNSHVDFGWHVHFVLLASPNAEEPEDGQPARVPFFAPFVTCQAEANSMASLFIEWPASPCWVSFVQRVTRAAPVISPTTPSQFLGTYLDSVSLRTLLRVSRC